MFDEICSALRGVICRCIVQEALTKDTELADLNTAGLSVVCTDNGLSIEIDGELYGITIEKV